MIYTAVPQVVHYPNRTPVIAASGFADEIAKRYGIDDAEVAARVADIVAQEIERVGRADARPVMFLTDDDQFGPYCSWCATLWPLCGHHRFSEVLDQHAKAEAES